MHDYFLSIGFLPASAQCAARILSFLQASSGVSDELVALASTCMAIQPNRYLVCENDTGEPMSIAVQRYKALCDLVLATPDPVCVLNGDELTDVFMAEPATLDGLYFYANELQQYVGSAKDWSMHVLFNGAVHPMTRQPITKLTAISYTALPDTTFKVPGLVLHASEQLCSELQTQFWVKEYEQPALTLPELRWFEGRYGIPTERCLSAQYSDDTEMA